MRRTQEVSKHTGGSWRALKWQHMPADRLKSSALWLAVSRYPPFGLAEHTDTFLTIYPKRCWDELPVMRAWRREECEIGPSRWLQCHFTVKSSLSCHRACSQALDMGGSMQFQPTVRWGSYPDIWIVWLGYCSCSWCLHVITFAVPTWRFC